jgi:hypothetical protein
LPKDLKKLLSIVFIVLPLLTMTFAAAFASTGNSLPSRGIVPNTFTTSSASIGGGWVSIYWGNATNAQPPLPGVSWEWEIFQLQDVPTGTVLSIKVTDCFTAGDSFELWSVNDGVAPTAGTNLGTTPAVPDTGTYENNANLCYASSSFSHHQFSFYVANGGTYNFTVRVVNFAHSAGGAPLVPGSAYMMFEDATPNSVGGYVIPSNAASVLTSVLLPFALLGALGLAVAYRKKLKF